MDYEISSAEHASVVRGPFACGACGHQDAYRFPLNVVGQATVGATSRNADEVAAERARKIAAKLAQQTITTLRCPRCQRMVPGALGRYLRQQAPLASIFALVSAVCAGGLALTLERNPLPAALTTFIGMAALICVIGFRAARGREVTFASQSDPTRP